MSLTWLAGLLRRRPGRMLAVAAGIGLAVALIGPWAPSSPRPSPP